MMKTLDLPVLSLAIPNINKLDENNTDNLSYMWTVFSKCKDSLENGRRLENMSWRLWYRESSLKRTAPISTPIPIQPPSTIIKESDKPLSSLKRIISSFKDNEIKIQAPKVQPTVKEKIMFEKPQTKSSTSKFFINEDESDTDEGWSSDSSDDEEESTPETSIMSIQVNTHHINDCDETAFLSEFKKRSPIKRTKGHSVLSNMLRAEPTRLATQAIHVVPNQKHVTDELSTSMRKCLEWEQHGFAHDIILNPSVELPPPTMNEVSIGYW
ncbi:hypothetical protein INT48_004222 [Thamnidium elegans]|uniref:Nitrogen regulatory protein areA GATA-like domain-containing protein n=1 Tax=Thamnidium elegans TaxID=101142 RepID=A0A8H7SH83_9FUNG|nr:hypothetical protein INT48_004222 [Thamnidium elegans]